VRDPSKGFPRQQLPALTGISAPSSSAIQGWCDLGALLRWTSPLRPVRVATPRSPILPWVFPRSSLVRLALPLQSGSRGISTLRQGPVPLGEQLRSWRVPPRWAPESSPLLLSVPPSSELDGRRGAVCVGRLRPHAGPRGLSSGVFLEAGLSPSLAGWSVATCSGTLVLRATGETPFVQRWEAFYGLPRGAPLGDARGPGGAGPYVEPRASTLRQA
jgi:hypothetical protein